MKFYTIFLLMLFLFFLFHAPLVLAKKQIDNQNTLQPIPFDVAPNISHNINSVSAENQTSANPFYGFNEKIQNSLPNLLTNVTDMKNNNMLLYSVLIFIILLIAFGIFLYFKK